MKTNMNVNKSATNIVNVIFTMAAILSPIFSFPHGAPDFTCKQLKPNHFNSPMTSDPPFTVSASRTSLSPGGSTTVTIATIQTALFKGFLCVTSLLNDTKNLAVGTMTELDPTISKTVDCRKAPASTGVTHKSNANKPEIKFTWTTPDDATSGNEYKLRCAVVQNFSTYWNHFQLNLTITNDVMLEENNHQGSNDSSTLNVSLIQSTTVSGPAENVEFTSQQPTTMSENIDTSTQPSHHTDRLNNISTPKPQFDTFENEPTVETTRSAIGITSQAPVSNVSNTDAVSVIRTTSQQLETSSVFQTTPIPVDGSNDTNTTRIAPSTDTTSGIPTATTVKPTVAAPTVENNNRGRRPGRRGRGRSGIRLSDSLSNRQNRNSQSGTPRIRTSNNVNRQNELSTSQPMTSLAPPLTQRPRLTENNARNEVTSTPVRPRQPNLVTSLLQSLPTSIGAINFGDQELIVFNIQDLLPFLGTDLLSRLGFEENNMVSLGGDSNQFRRWPNGQSLSQTRNDFISRLSQFGNAPSRIDNTLWNMNAFPNERPLVTTTTRFSDPNAIDREIFSNIHSRNNINRDFASSTGNVNGFSTRFNSHNNGFRFGGRRSRMIDLIRSSNRIRAPTFNNNFFS